MIIIIKKKKPVWTTQPRPVRDQKKLLCGSSRQISEPFLVVTRCGQIQQHSNLRVAVAWSRHCTCDRRTWQKARRSRLLLPPFSRTIRRRAKIYEHFCLLFSVFFTMNYIYFSFIVMWSRTCPGVLWIWWTIEFDFMEFYCLMNARFLGHTQFQENFCFPSKIICFHRGTQ